MKSPVTVVLTAVVSSLATVCTVELLRGSRPGAPPASSASPGTPAAVAAREVEPLVPVTLASEKTPGYEERLLELERRLAALELGQSSHRAPVTQAPDELPPRDELRDLVLDWVAEEREARGRADELAEEENRRKHLEFKARHQALMLAQEHDLADWKRDKLFELFLEIETRNEEIGQELNPLTVDPEEFEARWTEFDEWADRRYLEVLGQALFDEVFGEED